MTTSRSIGFWSLMVLSLLIAVLRRTVLGALFTPWVRARRRHDCAASVDRVKIWVYVIAGLLTSWAGVLLFAMETAAARAPAALELTVIAAVVIGEPARAAVRGSVVGADRRVDLASFEQWGEVCSMCRWKCSTS